MTGDVSAVSLRNPPGGNRLGADHVDAAFAENVTPLLDEAGLERLDRFGTTLDAIHPHEPHWYRGR